MNGKFLSGVLSGVALVVLAFVLGSALFPVEASRSSAAVAPKVSEDPPAVPVAGDTEAGPDTGPETDTGTATAKAPDATTAAEATTPKPAEVAESTPEPAPEATLQTEAPEATAVVEPPQKAAETATDGVTATSDSPAESSAGATIAAVADPPSADPSPATEPDPQVAVVESIPAEVPIAETAPDTGVETASVAQPDQTAPAAAPEAAPKVPAAATPPAVPDLARLDAGAVLGALDKAATENAPPAAIDPPEAFQPEPALAADPGAETPAPGVAQTEAPAADTMLVEVEPPAADRAPEPDAMAELGKSLPAILPGRDEAGMPGTQPESLPLQDAPVPEPEVAALPEGDGSEGGGPESDGPESNGAESDAPDAELADGAAGSTLKPAARLGDGTKGVVVGRLPSIGGAAATDDTLVPEVAAAAPDANARPIDQFAATFENLDGKPIVAIVLIDAGAADLDRAGLASLPFPVSFALDPLDPATPERAALYRAAGKEVIMLATGIPDGAQASDIEVAFQSMAQGLPEAVAVMDLSDPTFQNRRPLASLVVPVVGAQGRGLLTWDAGLNAADQVARREDIPAAVVFRDLTSGGTDSAAVRRVLDRAVFKAGVDGRAVVAGTASAETVAALLEWSVEGKAATVALAPLTGVLMVE